MNKKLMLLALLTSGAMAQGAALPGAEGPLVSCMFPDGTGGMYPLKKDLEASKAYIAVIAGLGDPKNVILVSAGREVTERTYSDLIRCACKETCIHVLVRNSK